MNLTVDALQKLYRNGTDTPRGVVASLLAQCKKSDPEIWIHLLSEAELEPYLKNLENQCQDDLPLYGVPFAIKDNIDLAGVPTTAGCPEYAYMPDQSAFVVQQLISAGAIPLGKTNLDQFATGLVGTRSPYGACKNSFNEAYVSGGSSSGSAVAVAKGLCTFSLGTDTAGSGRVPAAFNNLLGVKLTRGLVSTRGVVPACRTLDCVSIFSLCAADAAAIKEVAAVFDTDEPYSRKHISAPAGAHLQSSSFTYGVPASGQLEFFGNSEYESAFTKSLELLDSLGGKRVEIDFAPFLSAARLLYEGPWVAERTAAIGNFLEMNPDAGDPVVRSIICPKESRSAVDCFNATYKLQALTRKTDAVMDSVDLVITPTAGTCYTIDELKAEPVVLNSNLGYYTNYMNLLDYCGISVPTAFTSTVPFGVTLVGKAFDDDFLVSLAGKIHEKAGLPMGRGSYLPTVFEAKSSTDEILLAVCGAHLKGFPLHPQLVDLKARFVQTTTTAPSYQMFALKSAPPKPGLIRNPEKGAAIEVEIYSLSAAAFGTFTAQIPHPLGIGKLELSDGSWVPGFIAEPLVSQQGTDITEFGGWRAYLESTYQFYAKV